MGQCTLGIASPRRPVVQFGLDDGAQNNIFWGGGFETVSDLLRTAVKVANAGIRIQKVGQSSFSRASCGSWGSRNSGSSARHPNVLSKKPSGHEPIAGPSSRGAHTGRTTTRTSTSLSGSPVGMATWRLPSGFTRAFTENETILIAPPAIIQGPRKAFNGAWGPNTAVRRLMRAHPSSAGRQRSSASTNCTNTLNPPIPQGGRPSSGSRAKSLSSLPKAWQFLDALFCSSADCV